MDKDQQLERIVAYLDGELSPEEGAQVEQQLASDQKFREQLQGAERAWQALDQLPQATVSDEFARTTMEMVVDAARQDVAAKTIALPVQRRKRSTRTALMVTAALLFGALIFRVGWQNPNRLLVADLPVIQNIDIYSQFRSVDFLQQLQAALGDEATNSAADQEVFQDRLAEFQLISATAERSDWLEKLPDDAKVTLRAKYNRYRDLTRQRQTQLRQLHEEIQADPNAEQLLSTMFRYQQWLSRTPASRQYQLRELPVDERVRQVAREMQRPPEQRFELTPEQLRALRKSIQPIFIEIFAHRRAGRGGRGGVRPQQMSDADRLRELFNALKESPEKMEELNAAITEALPDGVRQEFEALPPWERGPIVVRWLRQARAQAKRQHSAELTQQELADFFVEELTEEQKERLLALPSNEMQQQLRQLYRGEHGPDHFAPEHFGLGRGPNRGGPPREGPPHHDLGRRRPEFGPGPPRDGRPPNGRRPPRDRREDFREDFRGPRRGPDGPRGEGPSNRDRPRPRQRPEQEPPTDES